MTGVSGAKTERSGPKLGWSGAERERGAAERERSGERRSEKSGLMRSGKTFRSAPLTGSDVNKVTSACFYHLRRLRQLKRHVSQDTLLDLDLDNNRQSPDGYFGNGVCTPTGTMHAADSWLLKDDTEANEVTESGNEFHSVIVLAAKDF